MGRGVMQEVEDYLEDDRSSGELIAMGYKPATVYKTQRAWRIAQDQQEEHVEGPVDEGLVIGSEQPEPPESEASNSPLINKGS